MFQSIFLRESLRLMIYKMSPIRITLVVILICSLISVEGWKPNRITFNASIARSTDEEWDEKNSTDPLVVQMRFFENKLLQSMETFAGVENMDMMQKFKSSNISDECGAAVVLVMTSLSNFEPWALKSQFCLSSIPYDFLLLN